MATYQDLHALANDSDLQEKIEVAVVVAADAIRTDGSPPTNQAARLVWAQGAMSNPRAVAKSMMWAVLATNKSATVGNIQGATDAAIQTQVDAAVDLFAGD
jgi:hypothetical protein